MMDVQSAIKVFEFLDNYVEFEKEIDHHHHEFKLFRESLDYHHEIPKCIFGK